MENEATPDRPLRFRQMEADEDQDDPNVTAWRVVEEATGESPVPESDDSPDHEDQSD